MGSSDRAIAIVGLGAVLPDAPNVDAFRRNLASGRYSITETPGDRWDPALYYDPDPSVPDRSYSKIGGWVREWDWEPLKWRMPIPPKVADAMDLTQIWAITAARETLLDYGYPDNPLNPERTAVILGNAMGGDLHLMTAVRILFPEVRERLAEAPSFRALPTDIQAAVIEELQAGIRGHIRDIDEDTMPGELANITAGRIAALYDFKGPNYVTDAACASAMAAINGAISGLAEGHYDAVLTGGVDANMSPSTFVKFCKIGALSATGTRPYAEGADGFVMGEGAATFLMKRLADAERDGDTVYAVIRGIGGSSDGRGKGITAPNPIGQKLSLRRAWQDAGLVPQPGDLVEGHGTSTKVGDVVEVESLNDVFRELGLPMGSVALGSVKSNLGHLKGAAGAAGLLKATLALHEKTLQPSVNFEAPNPNIDFSRSPFRVNVEQRPWYKTTRDADGHVARRAGVSAFGFGGTNFHLVLEEHVPGRVGGGERVTVTGADLEHETVGAGAAAGEAVAGTVDARSAVPLRGALVLGGADEAELAWQLRDVLARTEAGSAPEPRLPAESALRAAVRLAIDYGDATELADSAGKALEALESGEEGRWRALRNRGVYLGRGAPGKVAFLFTGQGSQYVNMLRELRDADPVVAATFAEADAVMEPLLGGPLTARLFVDAEDETALAKAEEALKQTAVTQPAVLAVDTALARLMGEYGIEPDMTMGHSLGEYGALVAAGVFPFQEALMAVSARGRAMTELAFEDNGMMAAVFGPVEQVEKAIADVDGYVVIANLNSSKECVIGGGTAAVQAAVEALKAAGMRAQPLPVSHAFHTEIVAPASVALEETLRELDLQAPKLPVVANVSGEFYPTGGDLKEAMIGILARQIGSPVQFVKGLETLYEAGARIFVEMGPKRVLYGLVEDVLGSHPDVTAVYTNHPRTGGIVSANRALCGLYALGLGRGLADGGAERPSEEAPGAETLTIALPPAPVRAERNATGTARAAAPADTRGEEGDRYAQLGRLFADFLDRSFEVWAGRGRGETSRRTPRTGITGASLGLPGTERVFDEGHIARILRGESFIRSVPTGLREAMARRRITRLVKGANGEARFETIDDPADVIKLVGKGGELDLTEEYGFPEDRVPALDRLARIAIAAGLDALRDAGIPLVMRYKTTTTGSRLPAGWGLPPSMQDDTAVIFASAFPAFDSFAEIVEEYHADLARRNRLEELRTLREELAGSNGALDGRIESLQAEIDANPYRFDRRFLFRVLNMGHSQFAEYIGARGPNVGTNGACASTTQAMSIAQDWIEAGRCRRVIILTADDITTDRLLPWFGSGFLASGAAATDERVEDAALPFDRRRHGLIIGMGGSALVVEDLDATAERGLIPICEIRGSVVANSAFHGSRLDVEHISAVMERLVSGAEARWGLDRRELAGQTVFVSHETYTPARGGSASAEALALRRVFGPDAARIVVANTKGYTGHPMAVGIEDTLAVKMLETGIVPPVANFRDVDPELGPLNLSTGGRVPVRFALRLGAGFGSQIAMSLLEWTPPPDGARRDPGDLGFHHRVVDPAAWRAWLSNVTGETEPVLEVARRTLRVRDASVQERGVPVEVPHPTTGKPVAQPAAAPTAAHSATGTSRGSGVDVGTGPKPAVAPPAPAAGVQTGLGDPVREKVLAIVAEQTGYPPDMLELDLDLEADLGIDTVKQAEMFAAIRAEYGIERDENLALRDYPTLARAIEFVYEKRPDLAVGVGGAAELAAPAAAEPAVREVVDAESAVAGEIRAPGDGIDGPEAALRHGDMVAAQGVPRRTPVPWLRPGVHRFRSTGVALGAGDRVVVMPDGAGVADALCGRLERLGVVPLVVEASLDAGALEEWLRAQASDAPVKGVFWLPALDAVSEAELLDPERRRSAVDRRVKRLYRTMRALYDHVGGTGTFLVAATRMGGRHGYDDAGAGDILGGAVAGFTKSFARERPEALVKAVDFEPSRKTAALADRLLDEVENDPGVVEVGYAADRRWTVGLVEQSVDPGDPLDRGAYVVTGAAGSITSAIVADLARATGGSGTTFWLLDLTPEPDPEDADLGRLEADRDGLKRDIFARLKGAGERATPAMVERALARLERSKAALDAIRAVEATGASARYRSVDLRDADAVRAVMEEVAGSTERVSAVVHAAGLEISRSLPDKEPVEFDLVFDVKTEGWFNVLAGLADTPVDAAVVFSSIAGRFGNAGQADYSAANDLLCKAMSAFRSTRPGTRGVAIDWTAWGGIGMATRGSIPAIMREAGIDMLAPEAGIPVVRRELSAGTRGEVLIAEALGVMLDDRADAGGLDTATLAAAGLGPMVGEIRTLGVHDGLVVETILDPAAQPFLSDHQIDGTPVLPGVMGVEAMADVAGLLFPDLRVAAVEDVDFLAPFKFYRHEPRAVTVRARFTAEDDDDIVAQCELLGSRLLHGREEPEVTVHFRGRVRLTADGAEEAPVRDVPEEMEEAVDADAIYDIYFPGPAYQVLERAWRADGVVAGRLAPSLPANHEPPGVPTRTPPRLLELAFQTAGVMEIAGAHRMGLPAHIDRLRLHGPARESPGATALAEAAADGFDVDVTDGQGALLISVRGYRTSPLPTPVVAGPFAALRP
jgi:malonyl CoA-acyl carrier protein transacylase